MKKLVFILLLLSCSGGDDTCQMVTDRENQIYEDQVEMVLASAATDAAKLKKIELLNEVRLRKIEEACN